MGKLAALSSGLLARKGQARPAMRPQGFAGYTAPADDLGWNDMGAPAAPAPAPAPVDTTTATATAAELPPVLVERAGLEALVEAPSLAARTVSVATATRIRRETDAGHARGRKAAFTLRLDADRHLRLRLAGAVADRSAQALMVEALDRLLLTMPEVATLVDQLPPAKRR